MSLRLGDSTRMFGSSGWVVAMVGDASLAGSGGAVASGGSDGVSCAAVFLVGGDVADAGVSSDGVVALSLRLEFGAEHVDVVDQFEVGLFDLEVPELNRTGFCGGSVYWFPTSAWSACRAA